MNDVKSKFKTGQTVVCHPGIHKGVGWADGLKFKITRISYHPRQPEGSKHIYWRDSYSGGVYENSLKLVTLDWDE